MAKRINWGKTYHKLPKLDLIEVQKESFQWFLGDGIAEVFSEISPIKDFTGHNWELHFGQHSLGQPKITPKEAMKKGVSYDCPLKAEVTLKNQKTSREVKKEIFLGDIPLMTENGTFIINGIVRAVVNQITRSPGVFFSREIDRPTGRLLHSAEIRSLRGSWLEFFFSRQDLLSIRIDRRRKFPVTIFLRAMGFSTDEEIYAALGKVQGNFDNKPDEERAIIFNSLAKDPTKTKDEALVEIYQKMRPGEPAVLENAQDLFNNLFFNPRRYDLGKVGRYKINKRLGLEIPNQPENWILRREDVLGVIKYMIGLQNDRGRIDDIDHLANRRVRRVGELVTSSAFRPGLLRLERSIKEKMSLVSTDENVTPIQLINARPLIVSVNEFFRSNQLSTILDQTNPLAEIDNLRRLSVMGGGGISRERASFSIRDINSSQYGRICPVRSPEGPNIGLVTYLTLYTRANEYGFLETPYRRVEKTTQGKKVKMKITDEIVYLPADDEEEAYITHAGINYDDQGFITDSWIPVRYRGEFLETPVENLQYIDVVPRQVVGTSASLIPFLTNDSATRALMGTHMQCQAVPLVKPESPLVGTGMESAVAESMGWVIRARHGGTVTFVDGEKVIVTLSPEEVKKLKKETVGDLESIKLSGNHETYYVTKFYRSSQSTCYSQRPAVKVGQTIKKGDLVVDGPAAEEGELALGRNMIIAYCSLFGLGYEDAIIISDRLVKDDVLTSINIEEYEASLVETKLGPEELTRDIPNVSESDLANLAEDGVVIVGSQVRPNDILVGKIAPKGETELTAEERLLRAIFGEKAREVRDTSLRMPHGEQGTVIEVSILDREKGDELETGTIKKIIVRVAQIRKVTTGDKLAGRHGNKGVISKIVPESDMPYLPDGTPVDIVISPLSVLARMNLGQLLEAHLGWAALRKNYRVAIPAFENIDENLIINELTAAGLPEDGKIVLHDGRTGEPLEKRTVVGVGYILKLAHMVEDKIHARSTGPYSLVTQQPLGGKAQMGGQRLGEMEVWALEAHRAAYALQEMLTIKSDDVVGRAKTFEAIVKGTEIPEAMVPESFKVLMKELNSLGLDVSPIGAVEEKTAEETDTEVKEQAELAQKAEDLAEASGAEPVVVVE